MQTPVVLITGALTGIGRDTALAFAKEGARIVIAGRRDEAGQNLLAELRRLDAEAEYVNADVRHEDDVRNLVDKTVARFGRLDVAVNAAGTEGKPGPVIEQTAESYAATFDTNVLGTLLSIKHEPRVMLPQRHGSIINVSSTYGQTGAAGASIYAASKHAVVGADAVGSAGGRGVGRARQCGRSWSDRYRHVDPIYRHRREESRLDVDGTTQTLGEARRDRPDHRVSRVGQGSF
jgi:NADP-dependent 3-hydroxy acid dehydrogenase YdfG